jgi:misacylated tRNA(Ala) deacylase
MKPNEGRLQTAEHILAHVIERKLSDARFIISKFEEATGRVEIASSQDLRLWNKEELDQAVNVVISRNLPITKYVVGRAEAEKQFDLLRLPASVMEVRVVEIEGFDKTPCKDPHVDNTREVGVFKLLSVSRVGKDRYRFVFRVD